MKINIEAELARWEQQAPEEFRTDALWKTATYRIATYLDEFSWEDVTNLAGDRRTARKAEQLSECAPSIGATFAEGYSRSSVKDRIRFFEYSLGSARETRHWYWSGRHVIGQERAAIGVHLSTRLIQLLTVTVTREESKVTIKRRRHP